MTRKTLVALLIAPALFFFADQAFGDHSEKQKTKSEALAYSPVKLSEGTGIARTQEEEDYLVAELKNELGEEKEFSVNWGLDFFSASKLAREKEKPKMLETADFLQKNLSHKVRMIDPSSVNAGEWFGRCVTKYTYIVYKNGNELSNEGAILLKAGCNTSSLGLFRFDVAQKRIDVLVSEEAGYVDLEYYFKLYALAIA